MMIKREFKTTSNTFNNDIEEQLQFSMDDKLDLIASGVTLIVTGDKNFLLGEFSYIANTITSRLDFIHSETNLCVKVDINSNYELGERMITIRSQTQEDRDEDSLII